MEGAADLFEIDGKPTEDATLLHRKLCDAVGRTLFRDLD